MQVVGVRGFYGPGLRYRKVRWTFSVCQTELVANAFGAIGSVCASDRSQ